MKLKELLPYIQYDDTLIGVSCGDRFIREFSGKDTKLLKRHENNDVMSVHILTDNLLAVNVDLS